MVSEILEDMESNWLFSHTWSETLSPRPILTGNHRDNYAVDRRFNV